MALLYLCSVETASSPLLLFALPPDALWRSAPMAEQSRHKQSLAEFSCPTDVDGCGVSLVCSTNVSLASALVYFSAQGKVAVIKLRLYFLA